MANFFSASGQAPLPRNCSLPRPFWVTGGVFGSFRLLLLFLKGETHKLTKSKHAPRVKMTSLVSFWGRVGGSSTVGWLGRRGRARQK